MINPSAINLQTLSCPTSCQNAFAWLHHALAQTQIDGERQNWTFNFRRTLRPDDGASPCAEVPPFLVQMLSGSNGPLALGLKTGRAVRPKLD
eukprot:s830_g16.t1